MEPQRVTADPRIEADLSKVALKYGPLLYNVEVEDQPHIDRSLGATPLSVNWEPELLGGVMVIRGMWQDGSSMHAIPNFARMNREGDPIPYPRSEDFNHAESVTTRRVDSKVWI
jgi:hypothetical protein